MGTFFKFEDEFVRLQDGVVTDSKYGYCLSGAALSNTTVIPAGESVHIPFRAKGNSKRLNGSRLCCREELPSELTAGMQYQLSGKNCCVDATILDINETSYTMNLKITNISKETIKNWGMVFTSNDSITEIENAKCIYTNNEIKLLTGEEPQEIEVDEENLIERLEAEDKVATVYVD